MELPLFLGRVWFPAHMDWAWGHHSWWGGGVMMLIGLAIMVALAVLLVRALTPRADVRPASDAEQTLAARFARGEIDETEYRARRAVLKERR